MHFLHQTGLEEQPTPLLPSTDACGCDLERDAAASATGAGKLCFANDKRFWLGPLQGPIKGLQGAITGCSGGWVTNSTPLPLAYGPGAIPDGNYWQWLEGTNGSEHLKCCPLFR